MRSCTLPRGSILCDSRSSRHSRSSFPGTGFPLCLALLAGVFMSVQSAGSTSTGHSGGSQLVLQTAGGLCIRHSEESPLGLLNAGNLINPAALTIVTHPADVTDCEDHVVTFRVVVNGGTAPVTFTWQRKQSGEPNFTDIPSGSPNITYPSPGTLRVDNVGGFENPGGSRYRVKVTDALGSLTSNDALLTVNEITDIIPSVVFPSKTQVILCEGASFSYSVTTSGTPPVAYQWKKYLSPGLWVNVTDNSIISGSQTAVLAFNGGTPAESGAYKVNITFHASGADCHVSSDSRIRRVTFQGNPVAPVILQPPAACLGLLPDLMTAEAASGGSGSFRYQWQESWDGKVWNDIPGADTLSYQPPVSVADAWYRLTAIDTGLVSCGNVTSAAVLLSTTDCFNFHYRSLQDGAWHDRTIWETSADGITWCGSARTYPTDQVLSTHIRPGHLVEVTQDVSVARVTVEAGGAVTIAEGATVTNSTGNPADFIIESEQEPPSGSGSGSMISKGTFTGPLTYKRWMKVSDVHYFSSPVVSNTDPNQGKIDNVYLWDEPTGSWDETSMIDLIHGRSYCIYQNETSDGIITFSGHPNNTLSIMATSPLTSDYVTGTRAEYDFRWASASPKRVHYGGGGWNLLGNPFTSAMNAIAFVSHPINEASFDPNYKAIYIYDGQNEKYSYIGIPNGFWPFPEDNLGSIIQAGQGFFILAQKNNVPFIFDGATMQVHSHEIPLKSASPEDSWPGICLRMKSGEKENRTFVLFHDNMTTGLDPGYDIGQFSADQDMEIYTTLVEDNGVNFECQALPVTGCDSMVIPVGVFYKKGGNITFSANAIPIGDGTYILEDRFSGIKTDLNRNNYTVNLPPGTSGTGQFFLRYANKAVDAFPYKQEGLLSAAYNNGEIIIPGMAEKEITAEIFNMNGCILGYSLLSDSNRIEVPVQGFTTGIYLVKLKSIGSTVVVKIVVVK